MVKPTLINGCTYEVSMAGKTLMARIVDRNPVDGMYTVNIGGKEQRLDLSSATIRRRRATKKKTSTADVYLYMCDIGNGYFKIGVSAAPQRRQKQIQTYSGKASMRTTARIPTQKSAAFRSFEKAVMQRFAHGRTTGGTEVLRLSAWEANECATFMRALCSRA